MDVQFLINLVPVLSQGAVMTLELTAMAMLAATPLGLGLALLRVRRVPALSTFANLYVWAIRGTPLLMQLFLIYYGLPQVGITLSPFAAASLGMTVNSAAYLAEIMRAGIQSVDRGQMEAARSLGLTYGAAMRHVVLPQAAKRVVPPMGNEFIAMLKDSSLVSTIAMVDLMRSAQQVISSTFRPMEVYLVAGLMYLFLTTFFTAGVAWLERKMVWRSVPAGRSGGGGGRCMRAGRARLRLRRLKRVGFSLSR